MATSSGVLAAEYNHNPSSNLISGDCNIVANVGLSGDLLVRPLTKSFGGNASCFILLIMLGHEHKANLFNHSTMR